MAQKPPVKPESRERERSLPSTSLHREAERGRQEGGLIKMGFSCKSLCVLQLSGPSWAALAGCRAFMEPCNSQVFAGACKLQAFMEAYFTAWCQAM